MAQKVGIAGYGVSIPRERIKVELIVKDREHRKDMADYLDKIRNGLLLRYKTVASPSEDSTTLGMEAAENAVRMAGIGPDKIGAVYTGSESKPYAVGTISIEVASFLGLGPHVFAPDQECACNAGMQAVSDVRSKVLSGEVDYGLAIGTDVAQFPKGDPLEYACGAGAGAFLIGRDELVAELYDIVPYATNYRDFFKRDGMPVPKHFGKTTVYAYVKHTIGAMERLLKKHPSLSLGDFDHITFHQPSGYMPLKVCKVLRGIDRDFVLKELLNDKSVEDRIRLNYQDVEKRVRPWLEVLDIGNTYAASPLIGMASILDKAEPGEHILTVSYGSGAYSLATWINVLDGINEKRKLVPSVDDYIKRGVGISIERYKTRLKQRSPARPTFPKIPVQIEEAGDNDGYFEVSACGKCGMVYYPRKERCLNPDHEAKKMIERLLPYKAMLKSFGRLTNEGAYSILSKNKAIVVDCGYGDLHKDMELEPVIRRVGYQGRDGLISYCPTYRPLFRR